MVSPPQAPCGNHPPDTNLPLKWFIGWDFYDFPDLFYGQRIYIFAWDFRVRYTIRYIIHGLGFFHAVRSRASQSPSPKIRVFLDAIIHVLELKQEDMFFEPAQQGQGKCINPRHDCAVPPSCRLGSPVQNRNGSLMLSMGEPPPRPRQTPSFAMYRSLVSLWCAPADFFEISGGTFF